jgi:PEP-CTERM motif
MNGECDSMFKQFAMATAVLAAVSPATAAVITPGFTFAVAGNGSTNTTGTHFHSNTGGSFGNPAGKAEVGRYSTEEVRGLSEYNLTGLSTSPTAFVTFNVFKAGGLFNGVNDTPFTGTISVFAYLGNNLENLSDYEAASLGTVGSFAVGPGVSVGNVFSFDITSIFNARIANGDTSLGIRLQAIPLNTTSQAWTFDNFRLTTDNQTQGGVPEPATWLMMILGFGTIGVAMRRRTGQTVRVSFV